MSRVFDVFLFYNELDLLELRLNELYDKVDFFVITEVDKTFSGKNKPFFFQLNSQRFADFSDKIIYNQVLNDDIPSYKNKYKFTDMDLILGYKHNGVTPSKLSRGLKREIDHRDSCIIGLEGIAKPDDIILLSDVDEIPNINAIETLRERKVIDVTYFEMKHYMYDLNTRLNDHWYGTVAFNYSNLQKKSMDNLRYASCDFSKVPGKIINNAGWHLSYMGGAKAIELKLEALAWQGIRAHVAKVLNFFGIRRFYSTTQKRKDILFQGREFIYNTDCDWPNTLKKNPTLVKKINHSK